MVMSEGWGKGSREMVGLWLEGEGSRGEGLEEGLTLRVSLRS